MISFTFQPLPRFNQRFLLGPAMGPARLSGVTDTSAFLAAAAAPSGAVLTGGTGGAAAAPRAAAAATSAEEGGAGGFCCPGGFGGRLTSLKLSANESPLMRQSATPSPCNETRPNHAGGRRLKRERGCCSASHADTREHRRKSSSAPRYQAHSAARSLPH